MNEQRKGRFMLILLVLVFLLPVLAVVVLHMADWRPEGKSYGELVQPPKTLDIPVLATPQHEPFDARTWHGKWHMVYIVGNNCDRTCFDQLHMMRQLHAMLAKEIDRVQRVLIVANTLPAEQLDALRQQYPDLIILPAAAQLAAQFDLPQAPAVNSGRTYLVDPLGHFMMSYPHGADPYRMHKDLMRMLTYSWVG